MSNDIDDDFDVDDFDTDGFDDGGFDDLNDQKGTLGDIWRNNPLVKVGVIGVVILFLIIGVSMFGGESEELATSRIAGGQDMTQAPGTNEVSETIRQATEEETVRRTEEAVRANSSAMPTPIDPPKGVIGLQFEETEEEDPLERWRRMQQERIKEQQIQQPDTQSMAAQQPEVDTRTPAVNAMSQAMSQQMASILDSQEIKGASLTQIASSEYLEALREKEQQELEEALNAQPETYLEEIEDDLNIILPAGTIEYAQMVTEANTDAPGPILAQIVSGPLRGGRMIGSFSSTGKYLTLNFNTIVLDGVDYAASGIAIDPQTTLPGVVTDIDNRYFSRVILPTAAEFITGFTEAIAESGTTTITINGDSSTTTTSNTETDNDQEIASGIATAGEELAEILDDMADDVEPLLRVRAGTPIGILFVSSVVGTPQVVQQQEDEDFERERLLQFPSGFNIGQ